MDKLTPRHIQKFILELYNAEREDGRNKNDGKLASKTIKLYKSMISTICDYAVKMQMISINPCKNVAIPKVITPEKEYYSLKKHRTCLNFSSRRIKTTISMCAFIQLQFTQDFDWEKF